MAADHHLGRGHSRHTADWQVDSLRLDFLNKSKTASEILREVLDVPFTMPVWTEESLRKITRDYKNRDLKKRDTLVSMRNELQAVGLEHLMPEALLRVIE